MGYRIAEPILFAAHASHFRVLTYRCLSNRGYAVLSPNDPISAGFVMAFVFGPS